MEGDIFLHSVIVKYCCEVHKFDIIIMIQLNIVLL